MSYSPSSKGPRPRTHVESTFTLNFKLSSTHMLRRSDVDELYSTDCEQFPEIQQLIHAGIQATGTDGCKDELESELCCIKEQLSGAEVNIAYLLEWVRVYRHRWLEEYHRAENLEVLMPDDIDIPHLDQIQEGAPSPGFSPEFLNKELATIEVCPYDLPAP
ncbi:uncharacterized protein F5891DRAFT_980645 [Suillus fuscotomentosus]|uniref:Uncharacterized protein n=1 Tax=Suillus fuscotomentosus TaxID=1912939 RepID=A0AAD4E804_9AGAM|nr:uncharacterized protein F5891DRAFT_980645 [Suillus fuscotomentosus]KAG1900033.1 hypothetical protein F5891DRAFT_980645 [Suillus fuscotomentosus]